MDNIIQPCFQGRLPSPRPPYPDPLFFPHPISAFAFVPSLARSSLLPSFCSARNMTSIFKEQSSISPRRPSSLNLPPRSLPRPVYPPFPLLSSAIANNKHKENLISCLLRPSTFSPSFLFPKLICNIELPTTWGRGLWTERR